MKTELMKGFYLDDVLVEPLRGQVTENGESRHLRPKAVEVLLHLAERPGEVVTHDELLESIWGASGGNHEPLTHAVSELRQALDDHLDNPRFIQTMRGRGYRLVVEPGKEPDGSVTNPNMSAAEADEWPWLAELARRGVVQAGLAYLLVGWLLIQIADTAFDDIIFLPWWATPFMTILVIIGFPICLALAWIFEYAEGRWYVDPGHETKPPTRKSRLVYGSVVGALVVATVGLTMYRMNTEDDSWLGREPLSGVEDRSVTSAGALQIKDTSIAVLRFLNIDGSEGTRIFADGLAEDVLDQLARVPGLYVSSRGDSWAMPENVSSDEVREQLRVAYYLQGSVRIDGKDLRVVAELIRSEDGSIVMPVSFEETLDDLFVVQEQITRQTIASLRVALPPETQSLLTAPTDSPSLDAYVLYRQGKAANELPVTVETTATAIGYFEQALSVDENYVAAYAGLCRAYVAAYQATDDEANIDRAEQACAKAVATNANIDIVYDALGHLYSVTGRDLAAENAYLQALAINQKDVRAMSGLALVYGRQDRPAEAEEMLRGAIEAQPGNWRSINDLGLFYFRNGRYTEAANEYRQVVYLNRKNWQGHGNLGAALMMAGDFEAAVPALEQSIEIEPHRVVYSNLGVILYYLGRFDESVATHRKAVGLAPDRSQVWLNLADALQFSSERELAPAAFRKVVELATQSLDVNPRDTVHMLDLAWAQAMLGETDESGHLIARAIDIAPNDPYGYYYLALLELKKGRKEAALDALEIAVEKGYPTVMLASEPYLESLAGEERLTRLLNVPSTAEETGT